MLKRLSGHSLFLDDRAIGAEEAVPLQDGACLSFSGIGSADQNFLVFRISLRLGEEKAVVDHSVMAMRAQPEGRASSCSGASCGRAEYRRPSPTQQQQQHTTAAKNDSSGGVAVLECVHAEGADLSKIAPEFRTLVFSAGESLELGRQHQMGFFDELLKAEPQWLNYISRTHCRATLLQHASGMPPMLSGMCFLLQVENLSANVVLICGRQLAKGHSDTIPEGGTLAFVAKVKDNAEETQFLRFELRRMRRHTMPSPLGKSTVH